MKITDYKQELNGYTVEQLRAKLDDLRKELFSTRINSAASHVKDHSQFKKVRKNIARVLTRLEALNGWEY